MASAGGSATGSQTFNLYGFNGSFASPDNFKSVINAEKSVVPAASAYPSKKSVALCMKSGGTEQSALITIGGASGLAIRTDIRSGAAC